jgi:hypothetical protein
MKIISIKRRSFFGRLIRWPKQFFFVFKNTSGDKWQRVRASFEMANLLLKKIGAKPEVPA